MSHNWDIYSTKTKRLFKTTITHKSRKSIASTSANAPFNQLIVHFIVCQISEQNFEAWGMSIHEHAWAKCATTCLEENHLEHYIPWQISTIQYYNFIIILVDLWGVGTEQKSKYQLKIQRIGEPSNRHPAGRSQPPDLLGGRWWKSGTKRLGDSVPFHCNDCMKRRAGGTMRHASTPECIDLRNK